MRKRPKSGSRQPTPHPARAATRDLVVEAVSLRKGYGENLLIEDLSFKLPRGGIVGVIGGKRSRQDDPLPHDPRTGKAGRRIAPGRETARLAYVDQSRDALNGERQVWEEISDGQQVVILGRGRSRHAPMLRLQLQGPTSRRRSGTCRAANEPGAPGQGPQERRKPAVAGRNRRTTWTSTPSRFGGCPADFFGCAVVISHDRWFLDRIATHILAFEGDSKVVWFEGLPGLRG